MQHIRHLCAGLLFVGFTTFAFAEDVAPTAASEIDTSADPQTAQSSSLKELKNIKAKDLKVDANAAQPDNVKDPLQPLNRQIFAVNDALDRAIVRPIAVEYKEKIPSPIRDSYSGFRKNLGEPWNAVNQLIQGRPGRAAKTLGRFTINTVTTLGFADPASRLGLETEDENFGTTLGYWGVPSGPYLVLPVFGPSTFRDGFGLVVDGYARPQRYILEDEEVLYWAEQTLRGIDVRSQLIDIEGAIQGDKYSSIRDIYLQRKNFIIAEKKGQEAEGMFIDEVGDDDSSSSPSTNESHQMLDTE
ncbi:VacJ family lipoprotein [Acinetobacter johnsonii]|uniref:VacJ family lipoprotein n=1 Tax=Acinetobacter johnsonii TaxID=40214 RepID=A0A427UTC3_ACIJO|nr:MULTISPECIES: VacJ family lipoprotein [Acinetobacter]MBL8286129.1 VacJ family lipoprotein [Acinetobacter johnsonii]MDH1069708.1 VacJ family lipoprotein [Acinetobacter johnsonii]QPF35687.1 VacJ family lipoprotein [Acinetobacter johnsonii]RSE23607.1 VacJ family lipoprotein [Acinetobacter johnsonii]UNT43839.1 VacJ family lipoprotein [Acinetobacter sp. LUNF3]